MPEALTILLVDDHALVREMLTTRLESVPGFRVVHAVEDGDRAIRAAGSVCPHVVLMDVDMPGVLPFDAARRIGNRCPHAAIVFLSAYTDDRHVQDALDAGASAYVTKADPLAQLVEAIRTAAAGGYWFSSDLRQRLVVDTDGVRLAAAPTDGPVTLSAREKEVLRYVARGHSQKGIAEIMHLSPSTINSHLMNIMSRLNLHNRVELTRYAIEYGYVNP